MSDIDLAHLIKTWVWVRLPHTATDWPKCFCIYRLKCSKALSGWVRWDGWDGYLYKQLFYWHN